MDILLRGLHQDEEGILWGVTFQDAYLYRLDTETGRVDWAGRLLEGERVQNAFTSVLPYQDDLLILPGMAEEVILFHKESGSMQRFKIPMSERLLGQYPMKFFGGVIYKDSLYMQGFAYPGILKLDLETKKFTVIDDWLEEIQKARSFSDVMDGCFAAPYIMNDGKAYFPFMNANAVLSLDFSNDTTGIHILGKGKRAYGPVEIDDDGNLWLFPRDGRTESIVCWNICTGESWEYDGYPDDFTRDQYVFLQTARLENKIFAFSNRAGRSLMIDTYDGKMATFEISYSSQKYVADRYLYANEDGDDIVLVGRECILWWNWRNGTKKMIPFVFSEQIFKHYEKIMEEEQRKKFELRFETTFRRNGQVTEGPNISLPAFIKYVVRTKE